MSTIEKDLPLDAEALKRELRRKEEELQALRQEVARWEEAYEGAGKRDSSFTSVSGREVKPLYTPLDRVGTPSYEEALNIPGEYPYTRGPYGTMYRTRLWTMRQFAGFATAEETNERYHYLLKHGQTGLSVAFDFPTLMGYDSDHPRSLGEVGVCGVAISSLADMETLFDGIPLDQVSVSMTINGPAIILFCFYVAAAEKQGVPAHKLRGTVQNDILKEYQAQHAWVFPPEPALRAIVDMFEWCSEHAPKYNPISISGYHIREAGATAGQELAFTLRNGFEYVERGMARGLDVDTFAPRLSFFFDIHNDFFEEIAKLRAARRIWARHLKEKYGAKNPESWRLRTHCQTAGVTLTAQQPENNIVRVAYQAMAAVLGGPSPSTPTPWTRPWPSPRRRRSASRSGPSRSWPTRPGSPTPSTPWPAPTTWRVSPTSWRPRPRSSSPASTRWVGWSPASRRDGSSGRSPTPPCGSRRRWSEGSGSSWG
jgi:methylmalonyl-CoA mutase, N-terminal domain